MLTTGKSSASGLQDDITGGMIRNKQKAWIVGSISNDQMPSLWKTGVDVICVRGAACETGTGRQGKVSAKKIADLYL